ncbi:25033_t:CDS:2 [Dentiscutata erythropus]|uniref:25033_t:CDS:1 n=1 Tax=Dentiscutata erythropus TaxID=1348616 RepID=A0A9N9BCM4_9GLOM|nr:25033_t:CDS:2 [Dentiscutata erythropus]
MAIKGFRERVISSCGISFCLAVATTIYLCLTHLDYTEFNLLNYSACYYFLMKAFACEVEMIDKWIKSPYLKIELFTDYENRYLSSIQLSKRQYTLTFAEAIYRLASEEFFIFKNLADDNIQSTTIVSEE